MDGTRQYLTFVFTHAYVADAKKLITDEDQREIERTICEDPFGGKLEAGIRKIRIPLPGRGKRGGARVVYYYIERKGKVYLLGIFAKNVKTALSKAEKNEVRKLTKLLEEEK
jgi:hypothetical protein